MVTEKLRLASPVTVNWSADTAPLEISVTAPTATPVPVVVTMTWPPPGPTVIVPKFNTPPALWVSVIGTITVLDAAPAALACWPLAAMA